MVTLVWGGGEGVLGEGSPPPLVFDYSKEALGGSAVGPPLCHRSMAGAVGGGGVRAEGPPPVVRQWHRAGVHPQAPHVPGQCTDGATQCPRDRTGSAGGRWAAPLAQAQGGAPPRPLTPTTHEAGGRDPAPPQHVPPMGGGGGAGRFLTTKKRWSVRWSAKSAHHDHRGSTRKLPSSV